MRRVQINQEHERERAGKKRRKEKNKTGFERTKNSKTGLRCVWSVDGASRCTAAVAPSTCQIQRSSCNDGVVFLEAAAAAAARRRPSLRPVALTAKQVSRSVACCMG